MRELGHEAVEGFANALIRGDGNEIICLGKQDLRQALEEFRERVIDEFTGSMLSQPVVFEAAYHCPSYHPVTFTRRILETAVNQVRES